MLLALGLMLAAAPAARAQFLKPMTGRWCALMTTGFNDCSYATYQQCMATLSGIGGVCSINLQARDYPDDRRRRRPTAPW